MSQITKQNCIEAIIEFLTNHEHFKLPVSTNWKIMLNEGNSQFGFFKNFYSPDCVNIILFVKHTDTEITSVDFDLVHGANPFELAPNIEITAEMIDNLEADVEEEHDDALCVVDDYYNFMAQELDMSFDEVQEWMDEIYEDYRSEDCKKLKQLRVKYWNSRDDRKKEFLRTAGIDELNADTTPVKLELSSEMTHVGNNIYCQKITVPIQDTKEFIDSSYVVIPHRILSTEGIKESSFECVLVRFNRGCDYNDIKEFLETHTVGKNLKTSRPIHAFLAAINLKAGWHTHIHSTEEFEDSIVIIYNFNDSKFSCHNTRTDSRIAKAANMTQFNQLFVFLIK